ncbi:enoyl-CoA hydratase/isomerase family protein [Moraxella bovis]|uniref:enoyl-CoA hydratase/isomerase family protein n=1 Tax=Moraxella bovis TaxID=476 RepID=UPI0022267618|nr:enoyl-CoA hydratase/isomerase family protein [Moraxella bovis]UYZ68815.1 enoyl-CoA hydratase/isomerase family protein [Moraxella bovis]UYZ95001.1 enoyl-CoA hydratase/isomerase family protein [Moraxella bovis]UZA27153.1 enoyl-CoA hydratase/isomerase family protein [Moraxella bovis]WAJ73339.1 enoyl-CoA hydratase/isomerase family protein [Moraxella bovis]
MTDTILARLAPTAHGKYIGVITLNNPKALNAQNLDMVKATRKHLDTWADDDSVAVVVLHGTGDKGLCAGGDIKALYGGASGASAHDFFTHEYGLMHAMNTYPKPIMAWGHGIVMGGGMGLFVGSSHKVVTSATLMAMPEVSIGLFPDAGASYFLNHLAGKVGLFLGLTGARFTGADAHAFGVADFAIGHDGFDDVLSRICQINFKDNHTNHHLLSACLNEFHDKSILGESILLKSFDEINHLMNQGDLLAIDNALMNYQGDNDFIKSAIDIYKNGSDTTKAITFKIYHDLKTTKKDFSLKQIFDLETVVATHCVNHGDFKEGVRALLIDKDKNPKWRYTLADMPVGYIDEFFGEFV